MSAGWVWFDFENTPHVLFLEPLARELMREGWDVRFTAKPQSQTLEVSTLRGLMPAPVGSGDFVGLARKVTGTLGRALALLAWLSKQGTAPRLLVSCSRSASLAAWVRRVPAVALLDYEHAEQGVLALGSRAIWFPDLLRDVRLPRHSRRLACFYPGLKENFYLDQMEPDPSIARGALDVSPGDALVVARPPAETAHYASELSMRLWLRAVCELARRPGHRVVALARTARQRLGICETFARDSGVQVVDRAVEGPALVAAATLVVGGGGTMNREAAVLGVPVWSVFTGPPPRVDDVLASEGRLRWVRCDADLDRALGEPVPRRLRPRGPVPQGLRMIVNDLTRRLATS